MTLFSPRVVAVIGASASPEAVTSRPLRFLERHRFPGRVYPVNPRYAMVGRSRCYPSVRDLPECPDVALVAVPPPALAATLADCVAANVPLVSVFTATKDSRLVGQFNGSGTRLLGPGSMGFIDPRSRAVCTYSLVAQARTIRPGRVAIVSQSGGLGGCLVNHALDRGIGVSRFLCPGAGVDLDVPDLLEGLAADPGTRAVALLIEHVRRGPRFLEAVARLHASRTALIVMRIGRTAGGQRAATSHTGGIASDSRIFQAICRDVGVPVAHELDELIELAAAHAVGPRPGGPGVGIVTSSGGAAVLSADAVEDAGLTLPAPSGATLARLTALIPQAATVGNPLDLSAAQGPALFEAALRTAVEEPAYDALLVPLTMLAGTQAEAVAQVVGRVSREASKPVWVVWSAGRLADPGRRRLARLGCPVFATPTRAAQALRALLTPARQDGFTPALPVRRIPDRAVAFLSGPPGARSEWRTRALLALYGLPSPPEQLVETRDAAVAAAVTLGFPVALKVQATALPHKRAAGVMRLGLADAAAVAQAWDEVLAMARAANSTAELEGVLVQTMVSPESELLLGLYRDAAFGPILACGPGGSGVEAAADEVEFVRPLENRAAFLEWLTATRLARRLLGSDALDTVAGALTIVAEVVRDLGDRLREFDLNPLALVDGGRRALVLDALAVVASESSPNASE